MVYYQFIFSNYPREGWKWNSCHRENVQPDPKLRGTKQSYGLRLNHAIRFSNSIYLAGCIAKALRCFRYWSSWRLPKLAQHFAP